MTVAELIFELQQYPGELQVVLSKDAEGNNFSPLAEMGPGVYEPDTTYSGDFTSEHHVVEQYGDDEAAMNSLCLWPVN